jgi:hypothetical protein
MRCIIQELMRLDLIEANAGSIDLKEIGTCVE